MRNLGRNIRRSFLIRQNENYREICTKVKKSYKTEDFETAQRDIHSLKGVSGNISAKKIYELSVIVEQDVIHKNNAAFEKDMPLLEDEMRTLFALLDKELAGKKQMEFKAFNIKKAKEIIGRMDAVFQDKELEKINPFIKELVDSGMKGKDFELLKTSVKQNDFDTAEEGFKSLKKRLKM